VTVVPEPADLFLQWKQDSVECFLKGNNSDSTVQALFEGDAIKGI
jgi:hypothetical protein